MFPYMYMQISLTFLSLCSIPYFSISPLILQHSLFLPLSSLPLPPPLPPLSLSSLSPYFLPPPPSLLTHTVFVTPLSHLARVQSGHDVNLNCTTHGTFQWSYREKTYDSTSDCSSGICVNMDLLSETSHLSIHGSQTTVEGDIPVRYHVTQNVDDWFRSIPLNSSGTVTVYDEVLTASKFCPHFRES